MAASINAVALSGNLARDAEERQAGEAVALSFPLAVSERRKDPQTGEWGDRASYVDVTYFVRSDRALAWLREALAKGAHVTVQGRLRQDRWTDRQTGERRYRLGVVADVLDCPGARTEPQAAPQAPRAGTRPQAATPAAPGYRAAVPPAAPGPYDEDIPF
ncbi:MAG: single-stranded DNA-binding protein [Parafannyhessea sp.]|uniref:single-stranded DNA-binding protein n=1 Tax=Parafannyhessea sp. TaxID=2847324 RepID=UPI003F0647F3